MESTIITLAPSTASQVYDWLHRRVLRGELLPGARLSETEIAAKIGVSRQPVREAFIRLGSDPAPARHLYQQDLDLGGAVGPADPRGGRGGSGAPDRDPAPAGRA
ncbi:MAG TPA: GntR family transcriptional regulator [Paracoccus sp. (in: a-proteobacteria)]|nr:GntR family transcriptional regulator [Paracoccus sp. (in: a-proteobacteria)]